MSSPATGSDRPADRSRDGHGPASAWIPDPAAAGGWLRERLDDGHPTMHGVVPRGYPAYARILHPAAVRTLPDRPVPTSEEWDAMTEDERERLWERTEDRRATWTETAAAFGTTVHPLAQWQRLVRTPADGDWRTRHAPDGREFTAPVEGYLSPDDLAPVATHLAAHTTTPEEGVVGVWAGYGGLLGAYGSNGRSLLTFSDDPAENAHAAMLAESTHDPFNNPFRKAQWREGILSREISEGPRLELPDRRYVLFTASPRSFADPDWVLDVPWRDRIAEAHGFPPSAHHPNLLWPADRAWVMVSEIDFDSTVVAGGPELVRALCTDPAIEALAIREGADLRWDADDVNR